MSETLPRWSLPEVSFMETDPSAIESGLVAGYEEASGRTLADGDPVRLFLLSVAAAIIQLRNAVNVAAQQNLLSYATGKYLDELGRYLAVTRLPASGAKTTFRFTLSEALAEAYVIPAGFEVTNGAITFATDAEAVISPGELFVDAVATCTTPGEAGNGYLEGQIATIVSPRPYLASAVNLTETSGGAEAEEDAAFAERIRLAPNSFSVAGPSKAYTFHTYSVSSAIIDVAVTSPTPGVVNVYPLLEGGELPGEELLGDVEAYLSSDDIRPLTDEVHTLAPTAKNYAIKVDYWIFSEDQSRAEQIKTDVEAAVENYRLWQQGRIGRDILPDQLIRGVIAAGAARVDSSTLSPASFIELEEDEVAQCTGVTVNFKGYKAL